MKVLLFDNYDSFTYNLLHILKELGAEVEVHRNDKISLDEVERFDKILLSPGPGIPEEAGILLPLIRRYAPTKSILGVCLGEQAIGQAFGATLINLADVHHGVCSDIRVTVPDVLFTGLEPGFRAGRYHSPANTLRTLVSIFLEYVCPDTGKHFVYPIFLAILFSNSLIFSWSPSNNSKKLA